MKRSRRPPLPGARKRPARAARARAMPLRIALLCGIVVIAALVVMRTRAPRPRVAVAPDPADRLAPAEAYRRATQLALEEHPRQSLPYYRRALTDRGADVWETHYNYGVTLASSAMEYGTRAGQRGFAVRSSVERAGLMCEAMRQLDRAAVLAPDAKSRARTIGYLANLLAVSGFPWETLGAMRQTLAADPTDRIAATRATLYVRIMRDPSRYSMDMTVDQALRVPVR